MTLEQLLRQEVEKLSIQDHFLKCTHDISNRRFWLEEEEDQEENLQDLF